MASMAFYGFLTAGILGMVHRAAALKVKAEHDLVFLHVPYNFGETIELVRATSPSERRMVLKKMPKEGVHGGPGAAAKPSEAGTAKMMSMLRMMNTRAKLTKRGYEPWGHSNPDLFDISEVTGCPLFYTPPKYWPLEKAKAYFGDKTIFGVLRDPFERLVAEFRGDLGDFGGFPKKFTDTCDLNGAIKETLTEIIETGKNFTKQCSYLPQAEYFDGPFGIKLAIDNRRFPSSMNEAFLAHGYSEHIAADDVIHVAGCNDVWAGDLDAEARQLVKKVFKRDFELICEQFGYCDAEESTCIAEVFNMCPEKLFTWDGSQNRYIQKQA